MAVKPTCSLLPKLLRSDSSSSKEKIPDSIFSRTSRRGRAASERVACISQLPFVRVAAFLKKQQKTSDLRLPEPGFETARKRLESAQQTEADAPGSGAQGSVRGVERE